MYMSCYRAHKKVKEKELENQRRQEKLEQKLNGNKDINKWTFILELTFKVRILQLIYTTFA